MKIISNLTQYGDRGWEWDEADDLGEKTVAYRTNESGDGLWEYQFVNCWYSYRGIRLARHFEWKQVLGTCDFSLPNGKNAAYCRLRRRWYAQHR